MTSSALPADSPQRKRTHTHAPARTHARTHLLTHTRTEYISSVSVEQQKVMCRSGRPSLLVIPFGPSDENSASVRTQLEASLASS